MSDHRLTLARNQMLGTMADDPTDPTRQGWTFANALNAVSEVHNLTRIEEAIIAEEAAKYIARHPEKFTIFDPYA